MVVGIWFPKVKGLHFLLGVTCRGALSAGQLPRGSLFLQSQQERVSQQGYIWLGDITRSDILTNVTFKWLQASHWSYPHPR